MINSRSLNDLDPVVRDIANTHLALCHLHGIELIVTSTWRDAESQDALYAIGRTAELTRRPVTQARAWRSWHQYKNAYDVAPVVGGKPIWNAQDPVWKELIEYGRRAGAEAGADWPSFPDFPHFQKRPQLNGGPIDFAEAHERFQAAGTIFTA